jgi:hypothetical protein
MTYLVLLAVIGDSGTGAKVVKPLDNGRRGEGFPRSNSPRGRAWVFPFIEWPNTCECSKVCRELPTVSIGDEGPERAVALD